MTWVSPWAAIASTAVGPYEFTRLDALAVQPHARRAVEVALTGAHRLTLVAVGAPDDATRLAAWTRMQGIDTAVIDACACGNGGAETQDCSCSPRAQRGWKRKTVYRAAMVADLVVLLPICSAEHLLSCRRPEPDEALLDRASDARTRRPMVRAARDQLPLATQSLLRAAIRQLRLSHYRLERVLAVATSIAALRGDTQITPVCLAEALQYRPPR